MTTGRKLYVFLGYWFIIPLFQAPMIILILQTLNGKTANWSKGSMTFWGAWSLCGVIWGNTVGSYFDDYVLQLEHYYHDSYYQTEVTLYNTYPTYRVALTLKTIVNFINTVVGIILFRDWHLHVKYQESK